MTVHPTALPESLMKVLNSIHLKINLHLLYLKTLITAL